MPGKIFKICKHTTLICFEITAVIFLLSLIGIGFLYWRVTSGPVSLDFATSYIEKALDDPSTGYSVQLGSVSLEWGGLSEPLELELSDVAVKENQTTVLNIGKVGLGLSAKALATGQIVPVRVILNEPVMRLIRGADNGFKISLQSEAREDSPPSDTNEDASPFMDMINILSQPANNIDQSSPLRKLELVDVNNAKVVIEDHTLNITWFLPGMNIGFARASSGLEAEASVKLPTGSHQNADISLSIVYERDKEQFRFGTSIQNFDPDFLTRKFDDLAFLKNYRFNLNGDIQAIVSTNFEVLQAHVNLKSDEGTVFIDGIYDDKLDYRDFVIDADYNQITESLDVKNLGLTIAGVPLAISSQLSITPDFNTIKGPAEIKVSSMSAQDIETLWPAPLEGEGAEEWAVKRLVNADLKNLKLTMDLDLQNGESGWLTDVTNIIGDVSATNIDLDYHDSLLPIRDGGAEIHYENDTLRFDLSKTKIGDMYIDDGIVTIENVSVAKDGMVTIAANMSGALSDLFSYIEKEPIGVTADDLNIDQENLAGRSAFKLKVTFPTLKSILEEELIVKADGHLFDVKLPGIIKDLTLESPKLALGIEGGAATLSGDGQMSGRDVTFDWLQYFNPDEEEFSAKINAKFVADNMLRHKFGIALDDWMAGPVPVDLSYTEFPSGHSKIVLSGKLKDSLLMVGPFDYQKPKGQEGTISCEVLFNPGNILDQVTSLHVETDKLKVENGTLSFTQFKDEPFLMQGQLPNFTLEDNDLSLNFRRETNNLLKISLKGPFLDARPFLKEKGQGSAPYDGPPIEASVDVERMRTSSGRIIDQSKLYVRLSDRGMPQQLEMDAKVGEGDLYLRLKPDSRGLLSMHLEADDTGAMLKAFNLYDSAIGGSLLLQGISRSAANPYLLSGTVKVDNMRVTDAPILAQILNALTLASLPELLNNEGLEFSTMEAEFDWSIRPEGDLYLIQHGKTSGSSLGLTFEGSIDKKSGQMDIDGTVVPVSMFNQLLSGIPLVGDILTGGRDGAIFAATYSIEGPTKSPTVTVNPLAALTPGILRKLFFEDHTPRDAQTD